MAEHNWLQRHFLKVLYTLYIISLLLMIGTIFCFIFYLYFSLSKIDGNNTFHRNYGSAYALSMLAFFGAANAMVIFRVFALNVTLVVLHVVMNLAVLLSLVLNTWVYYGDYYRNYFSVFQFPNLLLISCFILQISAALFLVIFQTSTTPIERQKRAGIHCLIGLVTFAIHLWNILVNISMLCSSATHVPLHSSIIGVDLVLWTPLVMGCLIYFYSLAIIVILLTPYFESEYRAAMEAAEDSRQKKPPIADPQANNQKKRRSSSVMDSSEPLSTDQL